MLLEKRIKETERSYAHTEVWRDGVYLGYYMRNTSPNAAVNENWNFVSKSELPCFHARTKQELLNRLK